MYRIIIVSSLYLFASLTFATTATTAVTKTDLNSNWTCTTNASTANSAAEKAADDQMNQNKTGAARAFAFAAENCRDCTKITCEMSK